MTLTPESHLVCNPARTGGSLVRRAVTTSVPAGYVAVGAVNLGRASLLDYLYRSEEAGYPALYRRDDGFISARSNVSAIEAGDIAYGPDALTRIFVWVGLTPACAE